MTRTLIVALLSTAAFVGGYLLLGVLLPDPRGGAVSATSNEPGQRAAPAPPAGDGTLGDVEGVTLRSHDPATGRAVAEVRIGRYKRADDSQVTLDRIDATVVAGDGLITVSAPRGRVVVEAAADRPDRIDAGTIGLPEVARLDDVTIRYFARPGDADLGPGAALFTLRTDNLVFDNSRLTLHTADTTIDGRTTLADDVPVYVRGRDYDFDGRGLLVRYDPKSRRPTLLRVANGRSLTIKDAGELFGPSAMADRSGLMLASADPSAVTLPPERPETVYRGTVRDGVRATQDGQTLLLADQIEALFAAAPRIDASPAPRPKPKSDKPKERSKPKNETPKPGPVVLNWEGELRLELVEGPTTLAGEEDLQATAVGSPIVLRRDGAEARSPKLTYDRANDAVRLWGEGPADVSLADADGRTLTAERFTIRPDAGTALAEGAGRARLADDEGRDVRLTWAESCAFELAGEDDERTLKSVAARGDVNVEHPQFGMSADTLDLALDKGEDGKTSLKSATAAGGVACELSSTDETGASLLACERLTISGLDDAAGELLAEGGVRATRPEGDLSADALAATLAAGADGRYELDALTASGGVSGRDDAGRSFSADVMRVASAGEGRRVILEGMGESPAVASRGADTVASSRIEFDEAGGTFAVPAAGRLTTELPGEDGEQPMPATVTWTGGLRGDRDQIVVEGDVAISAGSGGQTLEATADTATLDLARADGDARELVGEVRAVTLASDVRATAVESKGGRFLRSFDLRTQRLTATPVGDGASRSLAFDVPVPGQVLFRDLRPSVDGEAGPAGFRGDAAVGWSEGVTWTPADGLLLVNGDATLAAEPTGRPPFALRAGTFRVEVDQAAASVSLARAEGTPSLESGGRLVEGNLIEVDPAAGRAVVRGTSERPVVAYDEDGLPAGRFDSLVYDLAAQKIERVTGASAGE